MLSRAQPIPPILRNGIRENVPGARNPKVTKETRVHHLMPLRVTNLLPQSSNKVNNPRKTRLFIQIKILPVT